VLSFAMAALLGYFIGSVPTGVLFSRLHAATDIRDRGSGSSGATNVGRVLGWKAGVAVAALDAAKGFASVWVVGIAVSSGPDPETLRLVAGFSSALGHVWPAFAGFRGGKAVATTAGVLLAVDPIALFAVTLVFAAVLATRRIVSLASVVAAIALPAFLLVMRWTGVASVPIALLAYALLSAALIAFTHRGNLKRIRAGTEPGLARKMGTGYGSRPRRSPRDRQRK